MIDKFLFKITGLKVFKGINQMSNIAILLYNFYIKLHMISIYPLILFKYVPSMVVMYILKNNRFERLELPYLSKLRIHLVAINLLFPFEYGYKMFSSGSGIRGYQKSWVFYIF